MALGYTLTGYRYLNEPHRARMLGDRDKVVRFGKDLRRQRASSRLLLHVFNNQIFLLRAHPTISTSYPALGLLPRKMPTTMLLVKSMTASSRSASDLSITPSIPPACES